MAEPAITLRAIHDSGPLAMPITRIVIHATCPNVGFPAASAPGAAQGTARYFQQPAAGGSAHYVEDPTTEAHCVPDNVTAWHAPPNGNSIGIEICAEGGDYPASYSREQWLSADVWPGVLRAAARAAELCDRFGVPKVKIGPADLLAGVHGICGHVDVSQAWNQTNHSDPGPAFPWPEFMAAVNGATEEDFMATMSDAEKAKLMDFIDRAPIYVWNDLNGNPVVVERNGGKARNARDVQGDIYVHTVTLLQQVAGLSAAVQALPGAAPLDPKAVAAAIAPAVIAALGVQHGLTQADVEAAVRSVFADVGTPPAA